MFDKSNEAVTERSRHPNVPATMPRRLAPRAITQSADLTHVLDTLLFNLEQLVPFDSANVMLLEEGGWLTIHALRGYEKWTTNFNNIRRHVLDLETSPLMQTALQKSVVIANTKADPDWRCISELEYVQNWLGVPLIIDGTAVGLFSLDKATADFFSEEHVYLAEMMAASTAAAVHNARRHARVQDQAKMMQGRISQENQSLAQQYQRQAALADFKITLHEPNELQLVLEKVVQAVVQLVPASDASIILWDQINDLFTSSASTVAYQEMGAPAKRVRQKAGATRWIVEHQEPLIVSSTKRDQFGANQMLSEYGYRAYAGVPLMTGTSCLGVLYALDRRQRVYEPTDIDFLQTLANHTAAAIENVSLFQALRKNEARLNSFISHAPVLLFALDAAGMVTFAQGRALAQLGFTAETAVGRHIQQLFKDFPQIIKDAERTLAGHHVQTTVEMLGHTWDIKYSPYFDELEEVSSIIGVATDVTDLKQAEEKQAQLYSQTRTILARTEALYAVASSLVAISDLHTLLQSIVDTVTEVLPANRSAIYIVNSSTQQVEKFVIGGPGAPGNQPASYEDLLEGLTGWVLRESRPALSPKDTLDPRESPRIQQRRRHHRAGSIIVVPLQYRENIMGTLTSIRMPDEPDFVEEDVSLLGAMANHVATAIQAAVLHREVQQHVIELEERVALRTVALTEANSRLLEMGKVRTKYMHDVSHELRTPLTTLKLYLQLLTNGSQENRDKYMSVLQETYYRMENLVEGVLRLSRLPVDKEDVNFAACDLNQIMGKSLAPFAEKAAAKNISLEFIPAPTAALVWADEDQLRLGIKSLLNNALTFTAVGKISVQVTTQAEEKRVQLVVTDTGSGIAPDDQLHLFEPFYRGGSVSQSTTPGMGIGLTMLKEIIDMHDGEIQFKSQLDVGSTFIVYLPACE